MAHIDVLAIETQMPEFRVSVTLSVRDVDQLWRMAAAHALNSGQLDETDLEDVIGPMEDPQVSDCLAMLLAPGAVAGCVMKSFAIETVERPLRKPSASPHGRVGAPSPRSVRQLHQ